MSSQCMLSFESIFCHHLLFLSKNQTVPRTPQSAVSNQAGNEQVFRETKKCEKAEN